MRQVERLVPVQKESYEWKEQKRVMKTEIHLKIHVPVFIISRQKHKKLAEEKKKE